MTVKQAALSYALATILNRLISNGIPDKFGNTHNENLNEDGKLSHTEIRADQQLFKVVIKREDGQNTEITDVQTFLGYLDVDVALTSQLTSFGKCFSIGKHKSVPLCLPLSTGMKLPMAAVVAAAYKPESSKIGGKNILTGQDTNDLEGEIVLPMVHAAISLCVPSHTSQQYLGVDTGTASCKSLPCLLHCVVSTTPIDPSFLT